MYLMPLPCYESPITQTTSPTTLTAAFAVLCDLVSARVSPPLLSSDTWFSPHFSPNSLLLFQVSVKCYFLKEGLLTTPSQSVIALNDTTDSSSSWLHLATCKFQVLFTGTVDPPPSKH